MSVKFALACLGFPLLAQNAGPNFEVASIKEATSLGPLGMRADRKGGPGTPDPGLYSCTNCPISWVLAEAYNVLGFEYSAPAWIAETRFDFAARIPAGTGKEDFRTMLQNLLVDRFTMQVHREKKEVQTYELSVAKNGPKFPESGPEEPGTASSTPGPPKRDSDGFPILPGSGMAIMSGHARIRSDHQPISFLVRTLSGQLGSPVVDATGLTGKYDYSVSWAFEENHAPSAGNETVVFNSPYLPALITAVQSQLGLKLDHKKGWVELLIVDHIDKAPRPN